MKNYREQEIKCCGNCFNVNENNTCIGSTYSCKIEDFKEVSSSGICDMYNTPQTQDNSEVV